MPRKLYSESEKMRHTIATGGKDVVVSDYCKRAGVSRSSIYRWRKKAGARCFSPKTEVPQMDGRSVIKVHPNLGSQGKTARSKPRCRAL